MGERVAVGSPPTNAHIRWLCVLSQSLEPNRVAWTVRLLDYCYNIQVRVDA